MSRRSRTIALVTVLAIAAAACGGDDGSGGDDDSGGSTATTAMVESAGSTPYEGYRSDLYAGGENWLCRPDTDDVCDASLDATIVNADGSIEVEAHEVAADPPVDCFYVYPTVSADPQVSADLETGGEEERAVLNQAARFSSLCRVFAPVYRQITVAGLGDVAGEDARELAYGDVVDAWKQYVSTDNEGRGVVLIGHSQGAGHLKRLISEEIDGRPELADRLVSALLLGSTVAVPDGEDVGGEFDEVPICTDDGQAGCVVSYATFRATDPPPATSIFGEADGAARAACTNPAALGGGGGTLVPYFQSATAESFSPGAPDVPDIETDWVTYRDFLTAECVREGDFDYLELTIEADRSDPRTDDIGGDLTPEWGLHIVDANVAMGNLLDVVEAQIATYGGG
jgi:hypothetical protein